MNLHHLRERGFSVIEFLITIAFLVVLLAVAVPSFGSLRDADRAGEILELVQKMSRATARFQTDTKRTAIEFSPARGGQSYAQPRFHELSMEQRYDGWKGPYLDAPLTHDDNPYGAAIYLQNNLNAQPADGFDLRGSGRAEATGPGQFVVLYGIPERIARAVDAKLDAALEVGGEGWRQSGRVEWTPSSGGALSIYISGGGE